MKKLLLAAVFLGASTIGALAQTATPPATANGDTPAVATPDTTNPTAPVAGANSFTEAQAKDRLTKAGYSDVTGLKLDDKGVWRATASKDGKSVQLALDYQGNIVAN
ncbi:PepSY domain-containing protein [Ensifer sp. NPDC090286]|uniref:PepSY domain-containing protein n=1 Tax=unclassified Ensifer TaxID=2633371 RepID=UPI0017824330|nr:MULTISPECIES: PepSY domain-containing protein [unclassified Ensifer]MBD9650431.1 PepSY domain-containing protein [Ensifer sp. ENS09]QRY70725.1 PepSY domain-containing protein [Ensifer sp. PDNC004]